MLHPHETKQQTEDVLCINCVNFYFLSIYSCPTALTMCWAVKKDMFVKWIARDCGLINIVENKSFTEGLKATFSASSKIQQFHVAKFWVLD